MTNRKNCLAIFMVCLLSIVSLCSCGNLSTGAVYSDYTGKSPSGSLGVVLLVAEHSDDKQVEVLLNVKGFGEVEGAVSQDDCKSVTEELVKYAKLKNPETGWEDSHYFYIYSSNKFKPKSKATITLYYFVPTESANSDLTFSFDYEPAGIKLEELCNVF